MSAPGLLDRQGALTYAAAHTAVWAGLRLAVLDIETTNAADGPHAIDVAIVTCRRGKPTTTWSTLVNPGVRVDDDPGTQAVHGYTDAHVADEDLFAAVEPEITRRLTANDGERLVLVGHRVRFDVGVLQREYQRLGLAMPDVEVLDTRLLRRVVGVPVSADTLAALTASLGIANVAAHSARGDAEATAGAVIDLISRAARDGQADFDALLTQAMARHPTRTSDIAPSGKSRRHAAVDDDYLPSVALPPEHTAGHVTVLDDDADDAVIAWQAAVAECAKLRCPYLADRVSAARLPAATVLRLLSDVLDTLVCGGARTEPDRSPAAAATVLGALLPLLTSFPNRADALRWHDKWNQRLATTGRCAAADPCPACRSGAPCPFDVWHHHLAPAALGRLDHRSQVPVSFLRTTGAHAGTGVFSTWRKEGREHLADHTAWLVYQHWRQVGQYARADLLAYYAWAAGGRDPRLVAAYVRLVASRGGEKSLRDAADFAAIALMSCEGSTDDGWQALAVQRAKHLGAATRLAGRPSAEFDEDGKAIPVRRHHPQVPRRSRPRRFTVSD